MTAALLMLFPPTLLPATGAASSTESLGFLPRIDCPTGSAPYHVAPGDRDEYGFLDLVTANWGAGGVHGRMAEPRRSRPGAAVVSAGRARPRPRRRYMCAMMLSANSLHLISVAPSICRAKSYVTRLLPMAPSMPFRIRSAASFQPR
jgi:hypothetical protein